MTKKDLQILEQKVEQRGLIATTPIIKANASEKVIHQQVCDYLKLQYPDVIFTSDASGLRLSIGLRVEMKKKRCATYKIPDLIILQPRPGYSGLIIEVKRSQSDVINKDGSIKKNEHIENQVKSLDRLKQVGYFACFGFGFEDCKRTIDAYMNKN